MLPIPALTPEWIERIELIKKQSVLSRLAAIREMAGNPMGVEVRSFGNAAAFTMSGIPDVFFNRVLGFHDEEVPLLDEIEEFYRERNIPCAFEISPFQTGASLYSALNKRGYGHAAFQTTLYTVPQTDIPPLPSGLSVREFREDEFDLFGEIYVKSFGMPETLAHAVGENNRVVFNKPGWTFYLALVDDHPAGLGVLYIQDGTAYLAAAGTHPDFQRRGCQLALHRQRLLDAARAGCDLVVSETSFGSQSMRNMQHVGFQVVHTASLLVKPKRLQEKQG